MFLTFLLFLLQACNPFGNEHPGFTSKEPTSGKCTVSSNRYTSEIMKNQLQQACFRSLSSEVYFMLSLLLNQSANVKLSYI